MANKEKLLESAQKFVAKGQFAKAIGEYQKLIEAFPRDYRNRQKLAELLSREKRNDEAQPHYEAVAKNFTETGFYLKAIAIYKQMQKIEPGRVDIYLRLAELNEKQGLIGNALNEYRSLVAFYEKNRMGRETVGVLQKMVALDPENMGFRGKLIEILVDIDDKDDALEQLQTLIRYLAGKGEHAKVVKLYEKFIDLCPETVESRLPLAESLLANGQAEKSLVLLKALLKQEPDNTSLLTVLTDCHMGLANYADARLTCQHLLREHSGNLELREKYARICLAGEDFTRALEFLEESKELFSQGDRVGVLRELYETLQPSLPDSNRLQATLAAIYEATGESGSLVFAATPESAVTVIEETADAAVLDAAISDVEQLDLVGEAVAPLEMPHPSEGPTAQDKHVGAKGGLELELDLDLDLDLDVPPAAPVPASPPEPLSLRQTAVHGSPDLPAVPAEMPLGDLELELDLGGLDEFDIEAMAAELPVEVFTRTTDIVEEKVVVQDDDGFFEEETTVGAVSDGAGGDGLGKTEYEIEIPPVVLEPDAETLPHQLPEHFTELELPDIEGLEPFASEETAPIPAEDALEAIEDQEFADSEEVSAPGLFEMPVTAEPGEETQGLELSPEHFAEEETAQPDIADSDELEVFEFYEEPSVPVVLGEPVVIVEPEEPPAVEILEDLEEIEELEGQEAFEEFAEAEEIEVLEELEEIEDLEDFQEQEDVEDVEVLEELGPLDEVETLEMLDLDEMTENSGSITDESPISPVRLREDLDEVEFYLRQGLLDDAERMVEAIRRRHGERPELAGLLVEIDTQRNVLAESAAKDAIFDLMADIKDSELLGTTDFLDDAGGSSDDEFSLEASAEDDEDTQSHFDLGIAYKEMGLLDDAITEFAKALRDPSRRLDCLTLQGQCLAELGHFDKAESTYKEGLALAGLTEEGMVALRYELGLLYELLGRPVEALESFQVVADRDLFYRDVTDKLKSLRQQLGIDDQAIEAVSEGGSGRDRISFV